MNFLNRYSTLGTDFFDRNNPVKVKQAELLLWNSVLADDLLISKEIQANQHLLAEYFSGNKLINGSEPISSAYAGHQFGNFVPQLGDGRAHLLGDLIDRKGALQEIQLKGSGPSKFSRSGDGRCAIGPAVREFIMSEAMDCLGVPTTKCLAVVSTGEKVYRPHPVDGAVVTRAASSHIRIGTFQFFAAKQDLPSIKKLSDYTISRHYPELEKIVSDEEKYVKLIDSFIEKLIHLVCEWMRVGFIHGVMNTDNMTLSGETIDYGPCSMMGIYDPKTVYSSIDRNGRYAYGNQAEIALWNVTRFAECLLPLISSDSEKSVSLVEPLILGFQKRYEASYMKMMANKLGLDFSGEEDTELVESFLNRLEEKELDYTIIFNDLTNSLSTEELNHQLKSDLGSVFSHWEERIAKEKDKKEEIQKKMRQYNPMVIPRNHHVEKAIQECELTGNVSIAEHFLNVLRSPYSELPETKGYQDLPKDNDEFYKTYCGT